MVDGETGRYPLFMSTYVKCIKFWMRVLKMSPHRLPYKSYKMLLYLQARNRRKWASSVCFVLYRYGFDEVWENQGVGDEKLFLKEFKDWLLTLYKQKMVTSLRTNDHFSFYSTFKSNLSLSPYLNDLKHVTARNVFIRIRLGVSPRKQI